MRASILVAMAAVLAVSATVAGQEKAASQSDHASISAKPLTVSGRVSADGKTFLTDIDSEWMVSNPDVMKGQEGRVVRVKCYVDTEKNSIKVLSVRRDEGESNYASRNTDSAFRR